MTRLAGTLLLLLVAFGCATPGPVEPVVPVRVGELDVITVSEAIEARDRGERGRLAVAGWYSAEGFAHACPGGLGERSPLELHCHTGHWGLTERRESMVSVEQTTLPGGAGMSARFGIAQGPWIQPLIEFPDAIFGPGANATEPVPVVLIGHFDDPRAVQCRAELLLTCRQRFVATELGWSPGRPLP